jgi:hypothetical protein
LGEGLGLWRDRTAVAEVVLGEESGQRREMTCGPHMSERERRARYRFGKRLAGPRARFGPGPEWSPAAFYSFLISFDFLFPVFCFYFYLLQKGFKSIQTSF